MRQTLYEMLLYSFNFFVLLFFFPHFAIRESKEVECEWMKERERKSVCVCVQKKRSTRKRQHEPRMSNRFLSTPKLAVFVLAMGRTNGMV